MDPLAYSSHARTDPFTGMNRGFSAKTKIAAFGFAN